MAQIQTPRMNQGDLRSVIRAFIANTIPKNRSHEIRVNVRMLDTRDNTAKEKIGKFPKTSAPFDCNFTLFLFEFFLNEFHRIYKVYRICKICRILVLII